MNISDEYGDLACSSSEELVENVSQAENWMEMLDFYCSKSNHSHMRTFLDILETWHSYIFEYISEMSQPIKG